MRLSKSYWQTQKETPADAEVPSHKLLMRAGFLNKTTGGIYSYLPMATKVLNKIKTIVREELDRIGAQEILMSFVTPAELWQRSGRWETMGPELIRLKDRKDSDYCLSATNEETITDIFSSTVNSYKQLPVNLYQINTKFRDEIRPRFGILRGREFIMKDAYTFHATKESMDESYQDYYTAYSKILERAGLEFIAVQADAGAMGSADSKTHEFQVIADTGEDDIIEAKEINYAANKEAAQTHRGKLDFASAASLEDVETKNLPTCEEVAKFLNIPVYQTLKTLVYTATYGEKDVNYMLMLLGDDELNEIKIKNFLKADFIKPATEEVLKELNLPKGYLSPVKQQGISVIFDSAIDMDAAYVVGANKVDFHSKGFVPKRDIEKSKVADIRLAKEGDFAMNSEVKVSHRKGIEVGHIFQLGDKYTKSMKASVLDQNGKHIHPFMGCYGIGISRLMAAAIEQHHDENGIIWPVSIAPFDIYLAVIGKKDETKQLSSEIYESLKAEGFDVLFDDRGMGPGPMFKDADLLGLPARVLLGERDYEKTGELEIKLRKSGEVIKVKKEELSGKLKELFSNLGKNI